MKEARYFFVPDADRVGELPQDEATHAIRVLRLQPQDEIFLMDGKGTFYRAEITLVTNKKCMYQIVETLPQQPSWRGHLHLAIAPTKMMERIEWMAEKTTEIGFDELSFLNCRFSERTKLRIDRIEKIVVSAVKQSRKAWMPVLNDMQGFKQFIDAHATGHRYICHCYDEFPRENLFSILSQNNIASTSAEGTKPSVLNKERSADGLNQSVLDKEPSANEDIIVLVGPEGDFSVDEVQYALAHGYESVTLGTSRLRTETAGLMAVTMMNLTSAI